MNGSWDRRAAKIAVYFNAKAKMLIARVIGHVGGRAMNKSENTKLIAGQITRLKSVVEHYGDNMEDRMTALLTMIMHYRDRHPKRYRQAKRLAKFHHKIELEP